MKDLRVKISLVLALFASTFTLVNAQTAAEVVEKFNEGAQAMNAGNNEEAIVAFEEVVSIGETVGVEVDDQRIQAESYLPNLYYRVAMDKYKEKDYDAAIKQGEKTIEVSEKYNDESTAEKAKSVLPKLYYAKAVGFYKAKDFINAVPAFEKAIELDPEYSTAFFSLAIAEKNLGNDDNMVKYLKKVIEIGPASNQTVRKSSDIILNYYLNLGKQAINEKKFEVAVNAFESSLEYEDDDADVYYYIALASNSMEDWDKAIENGNKAVEFETGGEEKVAGIYYEIAKAYAGKGDKTNACEAYSNAAVGRYEEAANYQIEHVLECTN